MQKIILIGYSGNFYDLAEEIKKQRKYKIIGYTDKKNYKDILSNFKTELLF